MPAMPALPDPYDTLGVSPSASDAELRAAYRRLVQLHHPDHNGGSPESARRFEEVQAAYAEVRRLRTSGRAAAGAPRTAGARGPNAAGSSGARRQAPTDPAPSSSDPDLDARIAAMEADLKAAREARDTAAREARRARDETLREMRQDAEGGRGRPTDEELGYYSTDDSFSKILDDAASGLADRLSDSKKASAADRAADLLDELAARLRKHH
jgi:curved DNA-binding protein CbpA